MQCRCLCILSSNNNKPLFFFGSGTVVYFLPCFVANTTAFPVSCLQKLPVSYESGIH